MEFRQTFKHPKMIAILEKKAFPYLAEMTPKKWIKTSLETSTYFPGL